MTMFPVSNQPTTRDRESQASPTNTIPTFTAYPRPGIEAKLNGETVILIGCGDWPGHSPVEKYIDQKGRINYEVSEVFTVTDRQLLPPSDEQMQQVEQTALQQQTRNLR